MAENYLSQLKGRGGVTSTPFVQNRERMLRSEAAREAELLRARLEREAQSREQLTVAPSDDQGMSIAQYVQNSRAVDPRQPWVRETPAEPSLLGYVPGFGNLLQMLWASNASADPGIDSRLGRASGGMAANNQRIRQRLDDFERERVRNQMLFGR